jgi:hypothetical protein
VWIAALALASPAAAQRTIADREYDCRIIASTRQFPYGVDRGGPPSLNAWGQVVFFADTRTEAGEAVTELRVGRGETDAHDVPESWAVTRAGRAFDGSPLGPFDVLQEAAIEDAARVVFLALDPPTGGAPGQGIYRVFTDHPPQLKPPPLRATEAIGGVFQGFDPLPTLGANPGYVVFSGFTASGLAFYRNGSVVAKAGEGGIAGVGPPVLLHPFQPWVAFLAGLEGPGNPAGVVVDGSVYDQSQMGQGAFGGLSLGGSVLPVAAYTRSGFPGIATWHLVRNGGSGPTVLVDADVDPFEPFAAPIETAVNTRGDVAFVSSPTGDGDTLLVADGGDVIHRVVCRDMFANFGSLVFFDLALAPRGMNGEGQIAFLARTGFPVPETGDFETFVVRADPLPGQGALPTSCAGLDDGSACDDGDPITFAACAGGLCDADPVASPPTSCVGLPDDSACDDGDADTVSFCSSEACVGMPLPVPEPGLPAAGLASLGAVMLLAAARPGRERAS